jgi:putative SOS response-associated peptidase YedK
MSSASNLAPMPGVFPDYPAPVVKNADAEREMTMMRWGRCGCAPAMASHFADPALVNRAARASRPCGHRSFAQEQIMPLAGAETKNRTFMQ